MGVIRPMVRWRPRRRQWAIERKHLRFRDVAAAGGWKDENTLLEIYQQPDEESVLAATSETGKLRERGVTASEPTTASARQASG